MFDCCCWIIISDCLWGLVNHHYLNVTREVVTTSQHAWVPVCVQGECCQSFRVERIWHTWYKHVLRCMGKFVEAELHILVETYWGYIEDSTACCNKDSQNLKFCNEWTVQYFELFFILVFWSVEIAAVYWTPNAWNVCVCVCRLGCLLRSVRCPASSLDMWVQLHCFCHLCCLCIENEKILAQCQFYWSMKGMDLCDQPCSSGWLSVSISCMARTLMLGIVHILLNQILLYLLAWRHYWPPIFYLMWPFATLTLALGY